jgi:phage baseplate assembly protein W
MIYTVTTTDSLDWSAKGPARIAQNVLNLLKTKRYEVAYNRTMGVGAAVFDAPSSQIESLLSNEIMELVDLFEPRASVQEVNYLGSTEDGNIIVRVVLDI